MMAEALVSGSRVRETDSGSGNCVPAQNVDRIHNLALLNRPVAVLRTGADVTRTRANNSRLSADNVPRGYQRCVNVYRLYVPAERLPGGYCLSNQSFRPQFCCQPAEANRK